MDTKAIAQDTIRILEQERYRPPGGSTIKLSDELNYCKKETRCYSPEEFDTVNFIASPAPNAGAVRQNEPENVVKIKPVLLERSSKVLGLAAHHECDALVLGAWGCGVFRNDPVLVAGIFRNHLGPEGPFYRRFSKVLFSVLVFRRFRHRRDH